MQLCSTGPDGISGFYATLYKHFKENLPTVGKNVMENKDSRKGGNFNYLLSKLV